MVPQAANGAGVENMFRDPPLFRGVSGCFVHMMVNHICAVLWFANTSQSAVEEHRTDLESASPP